MTLHIQNQERNPNPLAMCSVVLPGQKMTTKKTQCFFPSEEESYVQSSQNNPISLNPEGITRKIRPWRELTVEELLREFGDSWRFQPNCTGGPLYRSGGNEVQKSSVLFWNVGGICPMLQT